MTAILEKTATLRLAPDLSPLTPGERAAVEHLLQVGGILQRLYEDARHPSAERERTRLLGEPRAAGSPASPEGSDAARLFRLFQGPIATTLDNRRVPFLPVEAETPGKNVYPAGITAAEVEAFLAAHPEERAAILDDRTVVRRATAEALAADLDTLQKVPLVSGLHPFLAGKLAALAEHPDPQRLYAVPQAVAWARPLATAYLCPPPRRRRGRGGRRRVRRLPAQPRPRPAVERLRERRRRLGDRPLRPAERPDRLVRDLRRRALRSEGVSVDEPPAARRGRDRRAREVARQPAGDRGRAPLLAEEAGAPGDSDRGLRGDRRLRPGARHEHRDQPPQRPAVLAPLRPHHPDARQHHEEPRSLRQRGAALERGDRPRLARRVGRRRRQRRLPAHPLARDRALSRTRVDARRPQPSTRRSPAGPTPSRR